MQRAVLRVGHPDPPEAARRGIATQAVVMVPLTEREIEKRAEDVERIATETATTETRERERAAMRARLPALLASVADPAAREILRHLIECAG